MSRLDPAFRRAKRFITIVVVALLIVGAVDWWLGSQLGVWPNTAPVAHAEPPHPFQLQVVDEQGQPVPKCEVSIYCPAGGGDSWTKAQRGTVSFTLRPQEQVFDAIARADGFATAIKRFGGTDGEAITPDSATITLCRGDKHQIRLRLPPGMDWPQGAVPQLYFEKYIDDVNMYRQPSTREFYEVHNDTRALDFNMLNAHPTEAGAFEFQLAADTPPFIVGIHLPGFLQAFDVGPFTAADVKEGTLIVDVPQPATLEIAFDPGSGDAAARPFKATSVLVTKQNFGKSNCILTDRTANVDSKPLKFTDLAPGTCTVTIRTLPDGKANTPFTEEADTGRFSDRKKVTLKEGQSEKVDFHYVPLDPNAFRGKRSAVVRIEAADGKPAVGREVTIGYYDGHYGTQSVFSGAVPASGEIMLSDITDVQPSVEVPEPYSVRLDKQKSLGRFGFKTIEPRERFVFRCPPGAGDTAPDIELLNLADGKTVKLSDFRGELVLLDFWATWCGPCQPALEKLDKDVADHAEAWKDKIVVVPISIDDQSAPAKHHLIDRGWTHLNNYWTGSEGKTGWQAPAAGAFVISGVPTSVLIDREGKVIWVGHPLSNEGGETLESRIGAALQ